MAEVLSPPVTSPSPSPNAQSPPTREEQSSLSSLSKSTSREPRAQPRERVPSYAHSRMSQYSRSSQRSNRQSAALEYPAFNSSLPYALVRDFAYPVFHPLHYGAEPEPSGPSTPGSEWNSARRQSDPMEQWNGGGASGWSAGPWGGDGVMYGDPEEGGLGPLPSTSFGNEDWQDFGDDELAVKRSKHRKSKSYANMSDYERGRRRDSGKRSRVSGEDVFRFGGQQSDPAGRDSLRQSRGYGEMRKDSHLSSLPHRSFHHSQHFDEDEHIPLDIEPHTSHSPVRDSMGPEDEELFAGPSLALYSFEPENSNELRLEEGQEIMVSYRHGQGWLVASDPRSGEQGLVPEAYVRLIAEMPNYDPETGQFVEMDDETSPIDTSHHPRNDDSLPQHDRFAGTDGVIPVDEEREPHLFGAAVQSSSGETSPSPVKLEAPKLQSTVNSSAMSGSSMVNNENAEVKG